MKISEDKMDLAIRVARCADKIFDSLVSEKILDKDSSFVSTVTHLRDTVLEACTGPKDTPAPKKNTKARKSGSARKDRKKPKVTETVM